MLEAFSATEVLAARAFQLTTHSISSGRSKVNFKIASSKNNLVSNGSNPGLSRHALPHTAPGGARITLGACFSNWCCMSIIWSNLDLHRSRLTLVLVSRGFITLSPPQSPKLLNHIASALRIPKANLQKGWYQQHGFLRIKLSKKQKLES